VIAVANAGLVSHSRRPQLPCHDVEATRAPGETGASIIVRMRRGDRRSQSLACASCGHRRRSTGRAYGRARSMLPTARCIGATGALGRPSCVDRRPSSWRMGGAQRHAGRDSLSLPHGYHERGAMAGWSDCSRGEPSPERPLRGSFGHRAGARSATCPLRAIKISSPRPTPAQPGRTGAAGASNGRFVAVAGGRAVGKMWRGPVVVGSGGCWSRCSGVGFVVGSREVWSVFDGCAVRRPGFHSRNRSRHGSAAVNRLSPNALRRRRAPRGAHCGALHADHPLVRAIEVVRYTGRQWVHVAAVLTGSAIAGAEGDGWPSR
jgi:hypothetical protein